MLILHLVSKERETNKRGAVNDTKRFKRSKNVEAITIFYLAYWVCVFFPGEGGTKEKWTMVNEEDGIKVYSRDVSDSSLAAFKG